MVVAVGRRCGRTASRLSVCQSTHPHQFATPTHPTHTHPTQIGKRKLKKERTLLARVRELEEVRACVGGVSFA